MEIEVGNKKYVLETNWSFLSQGDSRWMIFNLLTGKVNQGHHFPFGIHTELLCGVVYTSLTPLIVGSEDVRCASGPSQC